MTRADLAVDLCRALAGKPLTTAHMHALTSINLKSCATALGKAGQQGKLHLHKAHRGGYIYCFLSQADCEAYGLQALEELADATVAERVRKASHASNMARFGVATTKPGKPPSVTIRGKASDMRGPVDYSRAKWTRDVEPRPTARYQTLTLEPDPRYPSFAGSIGRYDKGTA